MDLTAAFLIGLLSLLHCAAMCGGIIGALSMGLDPAIRADRGALLRYNLLYSLGRIGSYFLVGLLAGTAGALVSGIFGLATWLRAAAGLLTVLIALYVGGWLPGLAALERLGQPLWQRLQPLGQRLLPVRRPWQALAFGLVWGWLPCGLVYSVLVLAALSAGPWEGGLTLLAFGLGTLPGVLAGGILGTLLIRLRSRPYVRSAAAVLLLALGLFSLWSNLAPETDHVPAPDHRPLAGPR